VVAVLTTLSSLVILWLSLPAGVAVGDLLHALVGLQPARLITLLPRAGDGFLVQGVVVMLLASLIVGIRCSGAITGERERQTWEALLLTPLSAKQLIRGKLWGIMGASYAYLLAYAVPAVTLSVFGGLLSLIWVVLWLGLTLLAMYYIGAAGLWCSVRARDSWRALLGTMLAGYVGGLAIYLCSTPFVFMAAAVLGALLTLLDRTLGTQLAARSPFVIFDHRAIFLATCLALVLIFWLMSRLFLSRALRWIADRERTRHWFEEPWSRHAWRTEPSRKR
jgi:ABC-type transport system involved in multi-copper enzyme maturation permease subunit